MDTAPPFQNLIEKLKTELPELDDNACKIVLESTFRIDGAEAEEEAEQMPQAIAKALDINKRVLAFESGLLKRILAAKQSTHRAAC